jgi:signal transduction histidine kinase/ActR/RegA family two-component response regulator
MIAKRTPITAQQPADLSSLCVSMTGRAPLAMLAVQGESDTVCYVNSAFCDLVDQRPDQLVGKPFARILPQHSDSLAILERVRRTGKSETQVHRQTSDLQSGAWAFAMWPVGLDNCTVGIMIQVIQTSRFQEQTVAMNEALLLGSVRQHELTEAAQRLNAELAALRIEAESANRSKDLFLATLSHEVRTPLNAILGWASILRGGHRSDADVEEGMEVIERNCHAQAKLIDDLLDISRIVSGKMQLQIGRCELVDVIKAALEVVRPAAEAKHIQFETELDPSASGALCDENRMQQVIWNLLANAVKFTRPSGVVRIMLNHENSQAKIQISDPGQGISAEFLPHVFDRFRQAGGSTMRRHGGLGLGLWIVKSIVELHQGTVHAHSLGEGLGATFTVCLPAPAVHSDRPVNRPSGSFQTRHGPERMFVRLDGLRVLAVDDEVDARRVLARVLGEAGAIVTTVGSVHEALLALAAGNPEVLVSDIAMPDQDGCDLIRHVRGSGHSAKDLPAVALTAFAHSDDRLRALLAGFQIHVPKPVDPYELVAVIATLTGRTG